MTDRENDPAHKLQVLSMKSKAAYCYFQLAKTCNDKQQYGYSLLSIRVVIVTHSLFLFFSPFLLISVALHWLQLASQCVRTQQAQTPQQKIFFGSLCRLPPIIFPLRFRLTSYLFLQFVCGRVSWYQLQCYRGDAANTPKCSEFYW